MAESNVDLARRLFEVFNDRDREGLLALSAEDIVVESRLSALEGAYHGHDGARRWWDDLLGTFDDYRIEVDQIEEVPGGTISYVRAAATGATSSTPLFDPYWMAMQWRDGRVSWWRVFATEQEAREGLAARN
jgi:ketosteroid isomerase-like protein